MSGERNKEETHRGRDLLQLIMPQHASEITSHSAMAQREAKGMNNGEKMAFCISKASPIVKDNGITITVCNLKHDKS